MWRKVLGMGMRPFAMLFHMPLTPWGVCITAPGTFMLILRLPTSGGPRHLEMFIIALVGHDWKRAWPRKLWWLQASPSPAIGQGFRAHIPKIVTRPENALPWRSASWGATVDASQSLLAFVNRGRTRQRGRAVEGRRMEGHSLRQRWIPNLALGMALFRQYKRSWWLAAGGVSIVRGSLLSAELQDCVPSSCLPLLGTKAGGVPCLGSDSIASGLSSSITGNARRANRDGGVSRPLRVSARAAAGVSKLAAWRFIYLAVAVTIWFGHEGVGAIIGAESGHFSGLQVAVRCCSAALVYDTVEASRSNTPFRASTAGDLVGDCRSD